MYHINITHTPYQYTGPPLYFNTGRYSCMITIIQIANAITLYFTPRFLRLLAQYSKNHKLTERVRRRPIMSHTCLVWDKSGDCAGRYRLSYRACWDVWLRRRSCTDISRCLHALKIFSQYLLLLSMHTLYLAPSFKVS